MTKMLQQVVSSLNNSYTDESFVSQASQRAASKFDLIITERQVTNMALNSRLTIASLH